MYTIDLSYKTFSSLIWNFISTSSLIYDHVRSIETVDSSDGSCDTIVQVKHLCICCIFSFFIVFHGLVEILWHFMCRQMEPE